MKSAHVSCILRRIADSKQTTVDVMNTSQKVSENTDITTRLAGLLVYEERQNVAREQNT